MGFRVEDIFCNGLKFTLGGYGPGYGFDFE